MDIPDATEAIFTARTYVIALVIILGGGGYLWWRHRQRKLLLEVTAVSNSPFATEPVANSGSPASRFTTDLLTKVEWKRFEELVSAYYNKTGVVAARAKAGPGNPVHVRISWKGEQRPFACVHCVAQPSELISEKTVDALCQALVGEEIRRGYIVTPGKFSVAARDIAEEKHITLLPGDIFVEKLNALPEPARTELLRDVTAGDFTTPTCARCDVKMTRGVLSSGWQCAQCGDQLAG